MEFISPEISDYAEKHSAAESEVLKQLNRETHAKILMPQMLSGHLQGKMLSMFSYMLKPKRILEIGTFTGYSGICLAQGLDEGGLLHTIDINDELRPMINKYIAEAGCEGKIKLHIGNAIKIIPELNETFDLVFIDADKKNYSNYFDAVIGMVRKGGFILADNVLWSGKVLEKESEMDSDTKAIASFNKKVNNDKRVEVLFTSDKGRGDGYESALTFRNNDFLLKYEGVSDLIRTFVWILIRRYFVSLHQEVSYKSTLWLKTLRARRNIIR